MTIQKQSIFERQSKLYARPMLSWVILLGWLVVCVSFAIITFASMRTVAAHVSDFQWDKVYHALAYAVLTLGLLFAWPRRALITVFLVAFGLGVALEVFQGTIAFGRTASIWDAMANAVGSLTIIAIWMRVCPLVKHNPA